MTTATPKIVFRALGGLLICDEHDRRVRFENGTATHFDNTFCSKAVIYEEKKDD